MSEEIKIAIIDTDSMIYSSFYGNKVLDEITGEPKKIDGKFVIVPKTNDEIKATFDGIMFHIFSEGGFTHYIGFIKGKNTIGDRLLINPEYKQQRDKEIPEKWEFTKQYAIERWGIIEVNDIEVDDAVRITNIAIPNSHIVAIDKDLLWLEGTNFNWRKSEWYTVTKAQEEEYLARSLVIGDTVDNIKGLIGKGEKFCDKQYIRKVYEVLPYYINDYGLEKGIEQFYKNFKCLYILKESDKFIEIPTPIEVPKTENNETTTTRSRSNTGELPTSEVTI